MAVALGAIPGNHLGLQQPVLAAQLCQGIVTVRIRRGGKPIAGLANMAPLQHQFRAIGNDHAGEQVLSLSLDRQKQGTYRKGRTCELIAERSPLP